MAIGVTYQSKMKGFENEQ